MALQKFHNPIIPGYSPDPSICRVGKDFYLVNSTFEFFPGVPIYHSRNLVNWELIGHVLTRESQLPLRGCMNSGGIFAPTIRFHDGKFWMITTNVTDKGNFIVHTDGNNILGEWSEPAWIDHMGIDPSVFWDDDGRCYYCGTGFDENGQGIILFELNPMTGEILSEKKAISYGTVGKCPEGPHIYKKDGYYYLMIAEGGTEYGHCETMSRSKNIWGPYEACPSDRGIILTHSGRAGQNSDIQCTGHADIVDSEDGNWYLVCLAIRKFSHAMLHNLGRETYLAPVKWENGWPIVGKDGTVELMPEMELPEKVEPQVRSVTVDFKKPLSKHVMFTRNPDMDDYVIEKKTLTLKGHGVSLNEAGASPTIISLRQPEFVSEFSVVLNLNKSKGSGMGISAYYNNDYHYDLYVDFGEGKFGSAMNSVKLYKHIHDMGAVVKEIEFKHRSEKVKLTIRSDRKQYSFYCQVDDEDEVLVGSGSNAGLSTEGTMDMTFTGTLFSVFCEKGTAVFEEQIELKAGPDDVLNGSEQKLNFEIKNEE